MKILFDTERLFLREWGINDAEDLFRLNANPNVLKHTGDKPFKDVKEAKDFILNYEQYAKYGLGRWIVQRKSDQEFLGWCGLRYLEEKNETDIGFRFLEEYWNMGYATESARAALQYGQRVLKLKNIVGRCKKENAISAKVLEKIGMKFVSEIAFDGEQGLKYILNDE